MKNTIIAALLLVFSLAVPALAAQQDIAQISAVTASREALRTAINTQLSAVQSNFDEVYAVIDAGPVYVSTTAPADTKVVWIDTDQDNAIKVYISNTWTVVGSSGEGSYTLPTAAADTLGGVKVGARLTITDGVLSADVQAGGESTTVGDGTTGPYLDGTVDGGTLIKLSAPSGGNGTWTSLQGGNPTANRNWRLPIDAPPAAGTTRLINVDENTQMGLVDPATFLTPTGSGSSLTVTASGFDGNLATTDNTLQEIAQKVDDLAVTGLTSLPMADNQLLQATGAGTYAWTSTLEGIGNITGGGSYNNVTITQPATGATLTLVEGSTLATSGAYSLTLTATADSTPTFPAGAHTVMATSAIGSTVQAYDADLTTWAGITPGSGVGTLLGTPSSANLASAVTDETGSGVVVFGTSPTIATPAITAAEVNGSADDTLTAAEVSSTIVYNTGQSAADVALTLPTAASGYSAIFTVGTAQSNKWGVKAGTNDKIYLLAADGTVSTGSDNGYARMTAAQIGQSFACWTFKTDAYDWMCKAISIGTSTFAAN